MVTEKGERTEYSILNTEFHIPESSIGTVNFLWTVP
jgi:hypothetical protein